MGAFALLADEAEVLDGAGAGGPEPVRGAGVELGGFPGIEDEIVLAEYEAERAVEYVNPVVALVGPEVGFSIVVSGREDELVGLDASGRRVRGRMTDPSFPAMGRRLMRGSPVAGASTSSSRVTP